MRLVTIICVDSSSGSDGSSAAAADGGKILAAHLKQGGGYVNLTSIAPDARTFLSQGSAALSRAKRILLSPDAQPGGALYIPSKDCRLCAPIDGSLVGKFLCVGLNYADHCRETGVPEPEEPVIFSKFGSSIIGPGDDIVHDNAVTSKLDYEVVSKSRVRCGYDGY